MLAGLLVESIRKEAGGRDPLKSASKAEGERSGQARPGTAHQASVNLFGAADHRLTTGEEPRSRQDDLME
jgi:hypothetical protein